MVETAIIRAVRPEDAVRLAALMTGYRAAMTAGPTTAMDEAEASALVRHAASDPNLLLLGGETAGRLAGFALAFDLPEIISGQRAGQLDDLFVAPEARGAGLARALIARLTEIGRDRRWTHLRWLVPQENAAAKRLYRAIAEPAPWDSFRIELTGDGSS